MFYYTVCVFSYYFLIICYDYAVVKPATDFNIILKHCHQNSPRLPIDMY